METLRGLLDASVAEGRVTGAVALVADGRDTEMAVAGHRDLAREVPMTRDTVFRIASVAKPITAALLLTCVDEGLVRLDDPVVRWLPELADARVVRAPDAPVDDLVPLERPITPADLLTMRAGWGWASDFDLPAAKLVDERVEHGGAVHDPRTTEEWLADLASVPLLHQPGAGWLYNTCSSLQGVLVERVLGERLDAALRERLLDPLGMADTGFVTADPSRLAEAYLAGPDGLVAAEEPPGAFVDRPGFFNGAGALVSTLDDLHAFARCLTRGGTPVLAPATVHAMTTNQLTGKENELGSMFLGGQGWGYGGGVDVAATDPWQVAGRYGWVGGSGTSAYLHPETGGIAIVLTQRLMHGPDDFRLLGEVGAYAAPVFRAPA